MSKRKIEDAINDVLTGDARENALDFVSYLKTNEIPLEESETYWNVRLNDKNVCFIWIDGADQVPGPWTVWSAQDPGTWVTWSDEGHCCEHPECSVDERIKETAWAHVNFCANCGGDCSPGRRKPILGKNFNGVCASALAFTNPDTEALECAKKMVGMRKNDILGSVGK